MVEIGDSKQKLVGYYENDRPDLIILGPPRDMEFNYPFHTGVIYKLVSSAPCPVLTVRDMVKANAR